MECDLGVRYYHNLIEVVWKKYLYDQWRLRRSECPLLFGSSIHEPRLLQVWKYTIDGRTQIRNKKPNPASTHNWNGVSLAGRSMPSGTIILSDCYECTLYQHNFRCSIFYLVDRIVTRNVKIHSLTNLKTKMSMCAWCIMVRTICYDRNTTSFDIVSWDTSTYIRNLPNLKLSNWIE